MAKRSSSFDQFLDRLTLEIHDERRIRHRLRHGRLRIDRPLPFLTLYRHPLHEEVTGTERLVTGEAAYLTAPGDRELKADLRRMIETIIRAQHEEFGAFLLIEIWASPYHHEKEDPEIPPSPGFKIVTRKKNVPQATVNQLQRALSAIRIDGLSAEIEVERETSVAPPKMEPILTAKQLDDIGCHILGIEVRPVYRNPETHEIYPIHLLKLRRHFTRALNKTWFAFVNSETTRRPPHYHSLGPHSVTKAVWEVDKRLATVDKSFDILLDLSPVNPTTAWEEFKKRKFETEPEFLYRPLQFDPELLKRGLFNIPLERIEDPSLAHLFREKQEEIDRRITLLRDRNTRNFLPESIQLYGTPDDALVELSLEIMEKIPGGRRGEPAAGSVSPKQFKEMAEREFEHYKGIYDRFSSSVQIREDISSGLMVSHGQLLIGYDTSIPKNRAQALLQHEVGTHVLTYCNGTGQPMRLLYCGLAGYDEFQEGIAVLAEYLVGGLTAGRLKTLAARVLVVHWMVNGADFVESFRRLTSECGFSRRAAFTVISRIYRGGGFTKDMIYLRGLRRVLSYLGEGGDVRNLFIGKLAARHIPVIRELQLRNVLKPVPLIPRYLSESSSRKRLERVREGLTPLDLIPSKRTAA